MASDPLARRPEADFATASDAAREADMLLADLPLEVRAMSALAEARRHHVADERAAAEAGYRAALDLAPALVSATQHLAALLVETRRSKEAIEIALRLIALAPRGAAGYRLLGEAHANLGNGAAALDAFGRALDIDPTCAASQMRRALILSKLGRYEEAHRHLETAVALRPNDPAAHIELAVALLRMNRAAEAQAALARAHELRPVTVIPAAVAPPSFRALMMWAPARANTPVAYLVDGASYESRMLALVDGIAPDPQLAAGCDLVLNLIADVDQAREVLPAAMAFADRCGKPALNHPRAILATDRESIAHRLADVARCRVPRTIACDREVLATAPGAAALGIAYPLLARAAGTHGGDDFDRVTSKTDLAAFIARHRAPRYYVSEYVDYRSADGYFRKYRLIFVGDRIFPYHLAIGSHWKVHHYRTDMAAQAWMQQEEESFLAKPAAVFSPEHFAALADIRRIVGLDYFGIDCALDRAGNLLVFEVNACMLVEPDDSGFAYKLPRNLEIKAAFAALLAEAARGKQS